MDTEATSTDELFRAWEEARELRDDIAARIASKLADGFDVTQDDIREYRLVRSHTRELTKRIEASLNQIPEDPALATGCEGCE